MCYASPEHRQGALLIPVETAESSPYVSKLVCTQRMRNTVTRRCICWHPNTCVLSARQNCPSVISDSCSWVADWCLYGYTT